MDTVSIIIPCYNGAAWLREAIDSCLNQTYPATEIIVVDDGSTDHSLSVAQSYGSRVKVLSTPRSGVSSARNRGFEASHGAFIQYLDADDYILPEKIARDVRFLQREGADVVYSDWRIVNHVNDGTTSYDDIYTTHRQEDLITSLLGDLRLLNHTSLHRREIVACVGGYDENLPYMEDIDFIIRLVLVGADIRYRAGCYSLYRKYGAATHWLRATGEQKRTSELLMIARVESTLVERGQFSDHYRNILAQTYYRIARAHYDTDPAEYRRLAAKAFSLSPGLIPHGTWHYTLLRRVVGRPGAERLSHYGRRLRRRVHHRA